MAEQSPVMGFCGDAEVTLLDRESLGNARVILWRDGRIEQGDVAPTYKPWWGYVRLDEKPDERCCALLEDYEPFLVCRTKNGRPPAWPLDPLQLEVRIATRTAAGFEALVVETSPEAVRQPAAGE